MLKVEKYREKVYLRTQAIQPLKYDSGTLAWRKKLR